MATLVAKPIALSPARTAARTLTICHFTTAHVQLKSRSYHRTFLPLAMGGVRVCYLSPAESPGSNDGVDFLTIPKRGGLLRFIADFPSLLRTLARQRADLYHFQDPELLPAALALKLLFRRRVVYDAYEDFPSSVEHKQSIPRLLRPLAARAMALLEIAAARLFDGLITADPLTLRRLAPHGESRKLVFYNFPNLDLFPVPESSEKSFDLVYRGGISERTGAYVLLEAMRLLAGRARPVRLLLIGYFDNAAAESAFRRRVRALRLESQVEFQGRIEHEEMAAALGRAGIGISPLLAIPKFLRNIPVKIFEYWACGIPAIATDLPPVRPFFRNSQAGLLVPPGSAHALARAIATLLDDPERTAHMAAQGRRLVVERFNNAREIHKLSRFLAGLANPRMEDARRA